MKPQALQDAIKAAAAKKLERRCKGEWKEPVVKKHQMSAEEYKQAKSKQSPAAAPPITSTVLLQAAPAPAPVAAAGPGGAELVQQMTKAKHEFIREKESLLQEVSKVKEELAQCRSEMMDLRLELASSKESHKDIGQCRAEMERLRKELRERSNSADGSANTRNVEREPFPSDEMEQLRDELASTKRAMQKMDRGSAADDIRHDIASLIEMVADLRDENRSLKQDVKKISRVPPSTFAVSASSHTTTSTSTLPPSDREEIPSRSDDVRKTTPPAPSAPSSSPHHMASISSSQPTLRSEENRSYLREDIRKTASSDSSETSSPPSLAPSETSSSQFDKYWTPPCSPTKKNKSTVLDDSLGSETPSADKMRKKLTEIAAAVNPPPSPMKKRLVLDPHTAEKLAKCQGRDQILRDYASGAADPSTLYPKKHMSVQQIDGHSLVCFKKRVYVPPKLRGATVRYFLDRHQKYVAKIELSKNFIWPKMEYDVDVQGL